MEGRAVDVDGQPLLGHGEVGDRDRRSRASEGATGTCFCGGEAVLLEQPQELQLQRRADTGRVGFQPGPGLSSSPVSQWPPLGLPSRGPKAGMTGHCRNS